MGVLAVGATGTIGRAVAAALYVRLVTGAQSGVVIEAGAGV